MYNKNLKAFNMSICANNLSFNLNEIKSRNALPISNIIDFEKYKTLKAQFHFLSNFVVSINKNKFFTEFLAMLELEFIVINQKFQLEEDKSIIIDNFINEYNLQISIIEFLIEKVKFFPKNKLNNKAHNSKNLKINMENLEIFDFVKERFNDMKNYLLKSTYEMPDYITGFLQHVSVKTDNDKVQIIIGSEETSKNNVINVSASPDDFLGDIYYIYNAINSSFNNKIINYFIKYNLNKKIQSVPEDSKEDEKFGFIYNRMQLRYKEVFEKLA